MEAGAEFRPQRFVNQALAGEARHSLERRRNHAHAEMRLPARDRPGMAFMAATVIHHVKLGGVKPAAQNFFYRVAS